LELVLQLVVLYLQMVRKEAIVFFHLSQQQVVDTEPLKTKTEGQADREAAQEMVERL
jgi:hypothetical protein